MSNSRSHSVLSMWQKKPKCLIFSQREVLLSFTMLSIYPEIHSVKCINHIKWCVGLLLAGWVKCIPCQTRQPAGPLRKILIDNAVAINQLGKHESSLRCVQASLCWRKWKWSGGGGGRDVKKGREEDKFLHVSRSRKAPHLHPNPGMFLLEKDAIPTWRVSAPWRKWKFSHVN